jgi:hypothetical protein
MNSFESIIHYFDLITITGLCKPKKQAKYLSILSNNKFIVSNVNYNNSAGFEGNNSDVLNFSIEFKKLN